MAEDGLDAAATPVAALVVSDWLVARSAARDVGLDAVGFQGILEPIGVIITVAKHPPIVDPRLAMILRANGCRRAIWLSVSQYRSLVHVLITEPESDRASHINGF